MQHLPKGQAWEDKSGLFDPSTPGAETLWGWFLWFCMLLFVVDHHVRPLNAKFGQTWFFGFRRIHWVLFHVILIFFELLFVGSVIAYGGIKQSDMRDMEQTEVGAAAAVAFTICGHILVLVLHRKSKGGAFLTVLQRYGVLEPKMDHENEFSEDDPLISPRATRRRSYARCVFHA